MAQISSAQADNEDLDFTLANKTGFAIRGIYMAPSNSTDWGDNLISKPMENGDQLAITFSAKATGAEWDIRIVWVDQGNDVIWKKCRLNEISKFTLRYNRETDETAAETE